MKPRALVTGSAAALALALVTGLLASHRASAQEAATVITCPWVEVELPATAQGGWSNTGPGATKTTLQPHGSAVTATHLVCKYLGDGTKFKRYGGAYQMPIPAGKTCTSNGPIAFTCQ